VLAANIIITAVLFMVLNIGKYRRVSILTAIVVVDVTFDFIYALFGPFMSSSFDSLLGWTGVLLTPASKRQPISPISMRNEPRM